MSLFYDAKTTLQGRFDYRPLRPVSEAGRTRHATDYVFVGEGISFRTVPGLITPGQRIAQGTRYAPSQLPTFSLRKGDVPRSGPENFSAPLSVEYITIVLS